MIVQMQVLSCAISILLLSSSYSFAQQSNPSDSTANRQSALPTIELLEDTSDAPLGELLSFQDALSTAQKYVANQHIDVSSLFLTSVKLQQGKKKPYWAITWGTLPPAYIEVVVFVQMNKSTSHIVIRGM